MSDPFRCWYHCGVQSEHSDIHSLFDFLKDSTRATTPKKVVTIGASSGGYAAILFGYLLRVNEIHAIVPQTTLKRTHRLRILDSRWKSDIVRLHKTVHRNNDNLDLKQVLRRGFASAPIHLYYGRHNRLDRIHARRLESFSNTVLHSYPHDTHLLARWMKREGYLQQILRNFTDTES